MTDEAIDPPEEKPKDAVASISGHLSVLTTRDHALLRRMYLTDKPAAEGVVVKLLFHAGLKPQDYEPDYAAWRMLVHVAALLSGTGKTKPHDPRRGFGAALQAAGFSENRLLRLTALRGDALTHQIAVIGRMLAQSGERAFNLRTLFQLIERDPVRAEKARLRIAQDYYAAEARSEGNAK